VDGHDYIAQTPGSRLFAKYKEGQTVAIVYNPDRIRDIHVPGDRGQDIAAVIGIIISLITGIIGLYINLT